MTQVISRNKMVLVKEPMVLDDVDEVESNEEASPRPDPISELIIIDVAEVEA